MRGVRSQIKIQRLISGLEFQRPLSVGGWNGTVGFTWQRTSLKDSEGQNQTVGTCSPLSTPPTRGPWAAGTAPGGYLLTYAEETPYVRGV